MLRNKLLRKCCLASRTRRQRLAAKRYGTSRLPTAPRVAQPQPPDYFQKPDHTWLQEFRLARQSVYMMHFPNHRATAREHATQRNKLINDHNLKLPSVNLTKKTEKIYDLRICVGSYNITLSEDLG